MSELFADTPPPLPTPAEFKLLLDSVWLIVASILVFFMQAGFAFLESGMVRAKNAVNVIMKNYCDMCVGGLGYWAIGFGLMFGLNTTGFFGTTQFCMTKGDPWVFSNMFFQTMFAATAATIVSGALAERIRFNAYLIGSFVITTFIYSIFGSWCWNEGGWLKKLGFLDFAGSTVVHSVGAWCALAGILALGPRIGRFSKDGTARSIPGHNLPFVALGAFILWFAWFGFNAGSTVNASANIGKIALNTHLSGCAAAVSTIILRIVFNQPVLSTAVLNASLGGLVAVTAGCGYVTPGGAILIGLMVGVIIPVGNTILESLKIDDAVGAIPVHGMCGVWGTFAVGIFKEGPFEMSQVLVQMLGSFMAFVFVFPLAFFMYKMISYSVTLRVNSVTEQRGLDFDEHHEIGYPEFQEGLLHTGGVSTEDRARITAVGRN
jgi:ammonium transporter, Amt family